MSTHFKSLSEAYSVASGKKEAATLDEFYDAWQHLYDYKAQLGDADKCYLEKLICDGSVLTPDNREELNNQRVLPVHCYSYLAALSDSDSKDS